MHEYMEFEIKVKCTKLKMHCYTIMVENYIKCFIFSFLHRKSFFLI